MRIKKHIIFTLLTLTLSLFCCVSKWETIDYYTDSNIIFSWLLLGIESNQSTVRFTYWWNNFWWLFFIRNIETLAVPETVQLWTDAKLCSKKINGIYYNNQRWMRFRPLDLVTLNYLKNTPWNYDNVEIAWWFFTNCSLLDSKMVLWDITHKVWNYYYELAAWIELNFWRNSYINFGWITHLAKPWQELYFIKNNSWLFLSWHIYDSYWWIGIVSSSWWCQCSCIDIWEFDPGKICSWEKFIQYSNCGNLKIDTWTMDCSTWHKSAWAFCKYDDEQYLDRWEFTDTKSHRWFNYIEIMRKSCLHRGKDTRLWLWIYYPDDYIKKSEILKTLVKIRGIAFDNFDIQSEDREYPYNLIFEDVKRDNRFSRYTEYAFNVWLTDWIYFVSDNKKYLKQEEFLNRNETIKKIVETYNVINTWTIKLNERTNLIDVKKTDPYYDYILQAESLWILEWYRQKNGTYKFEWHKYITRAEFAKIISTPFLLLLMWYE